MPTENLISLTKAAAVLGVHPTTLRAWADKGDVPTSRTAGGHRRFRMADLEAWLAASRQGGLPGPNVVVQSALGRARFDLSDGRLDAEVWYHRLDLTARQQHRHLGRRLLALLMTYLAHPANTSEALQGAREVGREYEQLGRASGVPLAESVAAFLFFRGYLHRSVFEALNPATATSETIRAWQTLQGHIEFFTNEALLALVSAAEAAP